MYFFPDTVSLPNFLSNYQIKDISDLKFLETRGFRKLVHLDLYCCGLKRPLFLLDDNEFLRVPNLETLILSYNPEMYEQYDMLSRCRPEPCRWLVLLLSKKGFKRLEMIHVFAGEKWGNYEMEIMQAMAEGLKARKAGGNGKASRSYSEMLSWCSDRFIWTFLTHYVLDIRQTGKPRLMSQQVALG